MDPYQGLNVGSDDPATGSYADDLGIGLPGIAVLFGLEAWADRGGYLPFTGAGEIGLGGGDRLLKSARFRAKPIGMDDKTFTRLLKQKSPWLRRSKTVRQFTRMERDLASITGAGSRLNPMTTLFDKAKGNYGRLRTRYGTQAATRIWGVTQLGKFTRALNMVSIATMGAELMGGMVDAINEYEPTALKAGGPTPEFGGEAYQVPSTRLAWTQRQASLQAIHQSGMQARAALGNEAALLH
jgi:hypothetical protein